MRSAQPEFTGYSGATVTGAPPGNRWPVGKTGHRSVDQPFMA
jgi:hypothetical protein